MEDDEDKVVGQEDTVVGKRETLKLLKKRQIISRNEERARLRRCRQILKKKVDERDSEDLEFLDRYSLLAKEVLKKKEKKLMLDDRLKEKEDAPDILDAKCNALADVIQSSKHLIVYTGAGISTATSIPDYRGPNGIWTRLSKGENLRAHDLCKAEPTLTHMSLAALYRHGKIKHIVSQNCDGLHIRSGIPNVSLSEVHGNMFIEVCEQCHPQRIYLRLFDVTEKTRLRRHRTNRNCYVCSSDLSDSIVHFGEKRELEFPQNWQAAFENAKNADSILCLGSSLKVLKAYRSLWGMDKPKYKRPNLYIVNLQWTPKDSMSTLKIHAKVDEVLERIMKKLEIDIPVYERLHDPMFVLHTPLRIDELNSFTTKPLAMKYHPEIIDTERPNHVQEKVTEFGNKPIKVEGMGCNTDNGRDENGIDIKMESVSTCPGWFGKGFRKNRRRKKKSSTS